MKPIVIVSLIVALGACKDEPSTAPSASTPAASSARAPGPSGPRWERRPRLGGDRARPADGEAMRPRRDRGRAAHDRDGDGQLSDAERQLMREDRAAGLVDRLDADRDGRLSAAELGAADGRRPRLDLATADADHDGFVTVEEVVAAMPARPRRPAP